MKQSALRPVVVGIVAIGFATTAFVFAITVATRVSGAVPPCVVPNGVSATFRLDDAPPSLARALTELVGELAAVGEEFDATDVHIIEKNRRRKNRRLIFIWNLGNRWVVATERGGIGYNNPIFAFDISSADLKATFVGERVVFPDSVCSTASSLLTVGNQNGPAAPPKDVAK
jgi:hypothetical protein